MKRLLFSLAFVFCLGFLGLTSVVAQTPKSVTVNFDQPRPAKTIIEAIAKNFGLTVAYDNDLSNDAMYHGNLTFKDPVQGISDVLKMVSFTAVQDTEDGNTIHVRRIRTAVPTPAVNPTPLTQAAAVEAEQPAWCKYNMYNMPARYSSDLGITEAEYYLARIRPPCAPPPAHMPIPPAPSEAVPLYMPVAGPPAPYIPPAYQFGLGMGYGSEYLYWRAYDVCSINPHHPDCTHGGLKIDGESRKLMASVFSGLLGRNFLEAVDIYVCDTNGNDCSNKGPASKRNSLWNSPLTLPVGKHIVRFVANQKNLRMYEDTVNIESWNILRKHGDYNSLHVDRSRFDNAPFPLELQRQNNKPDGKPVPAATVLK